MTKVDDIVFLESIDPNTISDTPDRPHDLPLGLVCFKVEVPRGAAAAVTVFDSATLPANNLGERFIRP